jgi:hypothetical protein
MEVEFHQCVETLMDWIVDVSDKSTEDITLTLAHYHKGFIRHVGDELPVLLMELSMVDIIGLFFMIHNRNKKYSYVIYKWLLNESSLRDYAFNRIATRRCEDISYHERMIELEKKSEAQRNTSDSDSDTEDNFT